MRGLLTNQHTLRMLRLGLFVSDVIAQGTVVLLFLILTDSGAFYRSHSPTSLLRMKAFRIGRKPVGPWTNMRPPIRGGVFQKHPAAQDHIRPIRETADQLDEASDVCNLVLGDGSVGSDSDSSRLRDSDGDSSLSPIDDQASLVSSATSDCGSYTVDDVAAEPKGDLALPDASGLRNRAALRATVSEDGAESPDPDLDIYRRLSPTEYADWAIQGEVNRDIRDYPSLNPAVQLAIEEKYRDMHQQVKDLGLYDCPYIEYGKESIRYATLFTIFMVLLRYEWYIPSAIFLGLFWVSPLISLLLARHVYPTNSIIAPNHVCSSRCWSSSYHSQLHNRHPHRLVRRRLMLWPVTWLVEKQP